MAEVQHFYQAIGELQATLVVAEDGTKFLQTGSEQYPASVPFRITKKYQKKYQGQQLYWRVYPQFIKQELSFRVVTFVDQPQIGQGQFTLQGDWIESGELRIWRNADARGLNRFNRRPRALPISWDSAPPPDEAFWQLKAELVDGIFKILAAEGPFPHPPRLEKTLKSKPRKQQPGEPQPQPQLESETATTPEDICWEELTPVSGKLELTIKINTLPQVTKANGQCHFKVDCNGRLVRISVKQKLWNKLETASATYPQWVAAIAGQMGAATKNGFVLEQPNIQVFERKIREGEPAKQVEAEATEAPAAQQSEMTSASGTKTEAKTEAKDSPAESKPTEKPDPFARPSAAKTESQPKKIGKFNVQVR